MACVEARTDCVRVTVPRPAESSSSLHAGVACAQLDLFGCGAARAAVAGFTRSSTNSHRSDADAALQGRRACAHSAQKWTATRTACGRSAVVGRSGVRDQAPSVRVGAVRPRRRSAARRHARRWAPNDRPTRRWARPAIASTNAASTRRSASRAGQPAARTCAQARGNHASNSSSSAPGSPSRTPFTRTSSARRGSGDLRTSFGAPVKVGLQARVQV